MNIKLRIIALFTILVSNSILSVHGASYPQIKRARRSALARRAQGARRVATRAKKRVARAPRKIRQSAKKSFKPAKRLARSKKVRQSKAPARGKSTAVTRRPVAPIKPRPLRQNIVPKAPAGTLVAQVREQYPHTMPEINWGHIIEPEFVNGTMKGYHYRGNHIGKTGNVPQVTKITAPQDRFGVYRANYTFRGQQKGSAFFPDNWSFTKLRAKINEAYQNPISFQAPLGFIGRTKEGMDIQFWFIKRPGGKIVANSIYPRR